MAKIILKSFMRVFILAYLRCFM